MKQILVFTLVCVLSGWLRISEASEPRILSKAHPSISISALAFSPDDSRLAASRSSKSTEVRGGIEVWDLKSGRQQRMSDPYSRRKSKKFAHATVLIFSPDNRFLIANSASYLPVWNLNHQRPARVVTQAIDRNALALSPDGRTIVTHRGRGLELWDLETGTLRWTYPFIPTIKTPYPPLMESPTFSLDGRQLLFIGRAASSRQPATLFLLDLPSRRLVWKRELRGYDLSSWFLSPDTFIVKESWRDVTQFRQVSSGNLLRSWKIAPNYDPRKEPINDVVPPFVQAVSVTGQFTATSNGKTIALQDLKTGKPLGRFPAAEIVTALAFSHDGKTLAAGYETGIIKLWPLPTKIS